VNLIADAFAWLLAPEHWTGPGGIPTRLIQHLAITALAVLIAAVIALPTGVVIGHSRRGSGLIGGVTGAARALPTLGVLTLLGLAFGIGLAAPLIALVILAVPSLLAGAYAGVQAVDPLLAQAAKATGFNPLQVMLRVELPLALPVLVGGVRAATLQVVSTATLAAYTADVGLGRYLFAGLKTRDYPQMLAGAILVLALTLTLELVLARAQSLAQRVRDPGATSSRIRNTEDVTVVDQ
jgi:osmoprotectant transport system permease protein